MVLLSVTCIMIQLSVFLLFHRLGKITGQRTVWLGVALALMTIPLAAISYRLVQVPRPYFPVIESLPFFASFLSALGTFCLVPFLFIATRSKEAEAQKLLNTNLALEAEIAERRLAEERLQTLSFTDDLTGLFNRRGFLAVSEQQMKIARRRDKRLLLLYIDIDNMKQINDTFGHNQGDAALIAAATILRDTFRESDVIARVGGDEFVILAVDPNELSADMLTHRLREKCVERNHSASQDFGLFLSVGSAYYDPQNPCSIEGLMERADRVMYRRKREKRGDTQKKGFRPRVAQQEHLGYREAAG
jgi:diguanylate cyclase (GGDEF)-like protein